jgi:hypothetical protein
MVAKKQAEEKGQGTRYVFPGHSKEAPPPTFHHFPIMTLYYESIRINPLIISEPRESNHFQKVHQQATTPPIHEPIEYMSCSNHNAVYCDS